MHIGISKVDITPQPGVELCGFANRSQPSSWVSDQLYASVLYMEDAGAGFLLINLDLIGIEREFVKLIREKIRIKYNIPLSHTQLFATHTHSGPGTIHLNYCGEYNPDYLNLLTEKILQACGGAIENLEECSAFFTENALELGINRRNGKVAELNLKMLSFIKPDGGYKAVLMNYPMHPVCLKGNGISADYPGAVKRKLEEDLNGNPLVLFGLGAAADIDPPGVGVGYRQMEDWGLGIGDWGFGKSGAMELRDLSLPLRRQGGLLSVKREVLAYSVDILSEEGIDAYADKYLRDERWNKEFGEVFGLAVEKWRHDMKEWREEGKSELEISILEIGVLKLIFVSAELFQKFEKILGDSLDSPFMLISCSNGLEGYFPSEEEYMAGGYEVETAIFFYNSFLPRKGSLELIAEEILRMIAC